MRRPWLVGLVPLYAAGVGLRGLRLKLGLEQVERLVRPVVSVGNLSAGGAGKTPFTIALARLLKERGVAVDVLSRGYGRTSRAALRVDPAGRADVYGDEPLVIAREAGVPVYVAARRFEAGRLAEHALRPADVHLLDDGFQHRQLHRDVDIVLVGSEDLADCLLPAGNLREGKGALRRATAFAVEEGDDTAVAALERMNAADGRQRPVWRYRRRMQVPKVAGPVAAFCGIARPGQFFAGLEAAGVCVVARRVFPDHHCFMEQDLTELGEMAKRTGAGAFVTTAKDLARLGELARELERIAPVVVAGLTVELADGDGLVRWLGGVLPGKVGL